MSGPARDLIKDLERPENSITAWFPIQPVTSLWHQPKMGSDCNKLATVALLRKL